jgi:hypothetical protein
MVLHPCLTGCIVISLILSLFAGYTYLLNQTYAHDDPEREAFKPGAIFLAPFTWPFFLVAGLMLTFIKAILFGLLLVFFTLAAMLFRKPFFWPKVEPIITRIGRALLRANTRLLSLFAGDS